MSAPVISIIVCAVMLAAMATVAVIVVKWATKMKKTVESIDRKLK